MSRRPASSLAPESISRRSFLRGGAAAVAAPALLRSGLFAAGGPAERVTMGCIGMGGHGVNWNLPGLFRQKDAQIVAVCDVFDDRVESSRRRVDGHYASSGCTAVKDFRRVLDRKDIDAVMISTPDHWHVLMSLLAMRAGKDVICEKPTLTIEEGRVLTAAVARHGAVFQTSTEDRSIPCYIQMALVARNGLLGDGLKAEVRLPAGQRFAAEEPAPVPKGLDYDMWLGPAPLAPYTPSRTERQHWRHVWDYSGGKFSDWGMHQLDTVQLAFDKERTGPVEVEGHGTPGAGIYSTFVDYELSFRYADGMRIHVKSGGTGLRIEGADGWIGNDGWRGKLEASSDELIRWTPSPEDVALRTNTAGEHRDFLDCVKSRKEPYFPAEVGHRCATLCHTGNIAMRLGRKVRWDPEKEEFLGDDAANAMRSRPMRAPWSLRMA